MKKKFITLLVLYTNMFCMNRNTIYGLFKTLMLVGLISFVGCSDKDEPNVNPEVPHWTNKMTARLDSISLGDGAEKPFYQNIYDENGRLMGYEKNGYWRFRDSLQIHYDTNGFPDTVKVKKWLNDSYWGLSRETHTYVLHFSGSALISMVHSRPYFRPDSMAFSYGNGYLRELDYYQRKDTTQEYHLRYSEDFTWVDGDLKEIKYEDLWQNKMESSNDKVYYDFTFTYDGKESKFLLPQQSHFIILDGKDYVYGLLASMGCFGMLPKHVINGIQLKRKVVSNSYELNFTYKRIWNFEYDADDNIVSMDERYEYYSLDEENPSNAWWIKSQKLYWKK